MPNPDSASCRFGCADSNGRDSPFNPRPQEEGGGAQALPFFFAIP
jgi:hypothetical protein